MPTVLIIVLLIILLGGGGVYLGPREEWRPYAGGSLVTVLIIILILWLVGAFGHAPVLR